MNCRNFVILLLLFCSNAHALVNIQSFCQQGGAQVLTNSFPSSTKVQQSFPGATVTVYLTGTLTKASVYSDNNNPPTVKTNPYTCDSTTAQQFVYVANGTYDFRFSGTGVSAPFTLSAIPAIDPASVYQVYNVLNYGTSVGTGSNDIPAAQTAVNAACAAGGGTVRFPTPPSGTYTLAVNLAGGILVSNCAGPLVLQGDGQTLLQVPAGTVDTQYSSGSTYGRDSLIKCLDSTAGLTITGFLLDANLPNRTAHTGSPNESFNSDILLQGCAEVRIFGNTIKNGMTDDITETYDASHVPNMDTWVYANTILNGRRNNVSIVGAINPYVTDDVIQGAGTIQGTAPESGIDVEPDYGTQGQLVQNVHIERNNISASAGSYEVSYGGVGTAGCTNADNQIHDATGYGMNFEPLADNPAYDNTNCTLSGGSIYNHTSQAGVRVVGQDLDSVIDVTIQNNRYCFEGFLSTGILFGHNRCLNNLFGAITGNVGAGLGFVSMTVVGNIFSGNFSASGSGAGATGSILTATPASSSSVFVFDSNTVSDSAPTYKQGGPVINGLAICYGRGNFATNLSSSVNGGQLSSCAGLESDVIPPADINPLPGSAISCASSITVTARIQHVSGACDIANIIAPPTFTAPYTIGAGGSGQSAGFIDLIADSPWRLVTGGSSGTRFLVGVQAEVNSVIHLDYDLGTGAWSPIIPGLSCTLGTTNPCMFTDTGSNNAIATASGFGPPLVDGLCVNVRLAHSLQAGADTFAYQGGTARAIVSSFNPANTIGTAYVATGQIQLCYYSAATPVWEDMKQ
jgi:hypothetical protein